MSNKIQVRTIRAFYDSAAQSKLTVKFTGIVADANKPTLLLTANEGVKIFTPVIQGYQVVDGGTNTLITYTITPEIKELDVLLASNSGAVPSEFRDIRVRNLVTANVFDGGIYGSDHWDYYIKIASDGATAIGYTANLHGVMLEELGKAKGNQTKLRQFTIDNAGGIVIEPSFHRQFGNTLTLSIEGVPRASLPLILTWDVVNSNYSMAATPNLVYMYDEFVAITGALIGFSISAHR